MATRKYKQKYKQKQRRTRSRRSRSRSRRKLQKGGDIGQVSPPMNSTYPVKPSLDGIGEVKN